MNKKCFIERRHKNKLVYEMLQFNLMASCSLHQLKWVNDIKSIIWWLLKISGRREKLLELSRIISQKSNKYQWLLHNNVLCSNCRSLLLCNWSKVVNLHWTYELHLRLIKCYSKTWKTKLAWRNNGLSIWLVQELKKNDLIALDNT